MRKWYKVIGGALALLLVGGLIALWLTPHEPSFRGKPLSYWADPWYSDAQETPAEIATALKALQPEAIPYLLEKMEWKPVGIMVQLHERFPKFWPATAYVQGADPRGPAAHALGQFGPLASNAIPALSALTNCYDLPSSWYERGCAQAALIKIRKEPLAAYVASLTNTSNLDWYQDAMMIGEFGSDAASAIPNLIAALGTTNRPVVQAHALIALGMIHSQPETCIPAITPFLRSPEAGIRQKAVAALAGFKKAAKPAWNELLKGVDDPDLWTRQFTRETLKRLDPEAAAKAGIK